MDFAELQEWSEKTYPELYPAEVHLRRAERNRNKMNDGEFMFPGNRHIADHVFPIEDKPDFYLEAAIEQILNSLSIRSDIGPWQISAQAKVIADTLRKSFDISLKD